MDQACDHLFTAARLPQGQDTQSVARCLTDLLPELHYGSRLPHQLRRQQLLMLTRHHLLILALP